MVKAKRLGKGTTLGFITLMLCGFLSAAAQDRIKIELNMGQERPRLAAPDFKAANGDPQTAPLNTVFNQTLWNDLDNAGIFDMVAKSLLLCYLAQMAQLRRWCSIGFGPAWSRSVSRPIAKPLRSHLAVASPASPITTMRQS